MHPDEPASPIPPSPHSRGRWVTSEENILKARKFFEHAKKSAETRNYDYAVKLYCDGLALWPDAVEEGLRPLRVVATARRLEGGKAAGFFAARKLAMSGKEPVKHLINAIYLFGLDPTHLQHQEEILKSAAECRCDRVVQWIAPVLVDAYNSAKRLPESRYAKSCAAMYEAADIAIESNDDDMALEILQADIAAAQIWAHHHPDSHEAARARGNASGKLTIVKGRFAKADGFTDSLKDAAAQHDLHDREKPTHNAERSAELIERARQSWQEHPNVPAKLLALVDLMVRSESAAAAGEAVELLESQFALSQDYVFKAKADELRIRTLNKRRRELVAQTKTSPGDTRAQQTLERHVAEQAEKEIAIYQDRMKRYPTDLRVKYELGRRFYAARRFDEAIPLLQQAMADGRSRTESRLYLGRSFYEKGFLPQAVQTLRTGLEECGMTTGPLVLDLNYWLGRSLEAARRPTEAGEVYGHLIQLDYNYRDARQRLEQLVGGGDGPGAG